MILRCPYRETRGISGLLFIIIISILSSMFLVCSSSSSLSTPQQQQHHHNISSFNCTKGVTCASPELSSHHDKHSKKTDDASCLKRAFGMLDAEFFNDSKMLEIKKGAKEFNIPIIEANRKAVATTNGGLHYHSPFVFHSKWKYEEAQDDTKRFNYPSVTGDTRPKNDEDIAFMTILELGHLIRTKRVSSVELVEIFLKRLKRYNPVLEAVITITEDLAYKQAKQADQLLAQGVDLGTAQDDQKDLLQMCTMGKTSNIIC